MKAILDTHAFIWWVSDPARLSPAARQFCQDRANVILLSVASIWEIQIKMQLGKLQVRRPLSSLIVDQQQANGLAVLPIQLHHVLTLDKIPMHHKDPFDRLLIAQAQAKSACLISHDQMLAKYVGVSLVW